MLTPKNKGIRQTCIFYSKNRIIKADMYPTSKHLTKNEINLLKKFLFEDSDFENIRLDSQA